MDSEPFRLSSAERHPPDPFAVEAAWDEGEVEVPKGVALWQSESRETESREREL